LYKKTPRELTQNLERPLEQLGSNLEAQEPPKSSPKPEKIDVEKNTFLDSIF